MVNYLVHCGTLITEATGKTGKLHKYTFFIKIFLKTSSDYLPQKFALLTLRILDPNALSLTNVEINRVYNLCVQRHFIYKTSVNHIAKFSSQCDHQLAALRNEKDKMTLVLNKLNADVRKGIESISK